MITRKEKNEPGDFWKKVEEELGEKIQVYTLGQCLGGDDIEFSMWGLFFVTSKELHFRYFKQENWFSMLAKIGGMKKSEPEEVAIAITIDSIQSLDDLTSKKFIDRLFGNAVPTYKLIYQDEGQNKELLFSLEMKSQELVHALSIG